MSKVPKECECGCGEWTKGGRFRPGHDARMHGKSKPPTGAHGTAGTAPLPPDAGQRPSEPEIAEEGHGTSLRPGMLVRAQIGSRTEDAAVRTGIVFRTTQFGWCAFVDSEGRQCIGYQGRTFIENGDVKAVLRGATATQKAALIRLGAWPS